MRRNLIAFLVLAMAAPAMAQVSYHVTGRNIVVPGPQGGPDRDNKVWLFDSAGNLTGSYDQAGSAATDAWGYRDGATDGNNDVYFGWGGGINKHAADGTFLGQVVTGGGPNGTWRALAFDPSGDGGAGSLWSGDFGDDIVEIDLAGNVLNTLTNGGQYSLYGLAYDDSTGNLWGHSTGGDVVEISTADGTALGSFTEGFTGGTPSTAVTNGGLSGFSETGGELVALCQCTPNDLVGHYSTAGALGFNFDSFGPITAGGLDVQNLGIAVTAVPEPAGFALFGLALAGLGFIRRK